jgi:hypothetical protein
MPRLTIDSKENCYVLDEGQLKAVQSGANSITLDPGTYLVRINQGAFSYWKDNTQQLFTPEPWVLLWIYGGKFTNKNTGVEVGATWVSLNGYDDVLVLDVAETTTIAGLFLDTYAKDNAGQVTLSILKDE